MIERLKGVLERILEWWNKFDTKRKMIIASSVVVVVVALVILGAVLMQPRMEQLVACETTKDASDIKTLLEAEGITPEISEDGLLIRVKKSDLSTAKLVMGANGYPAADYDLESVFSGGFSATEADKKKRYTAYLEEKIASDLSSMDVIDSARVTLDIPIEDGTIISKDQDTYASVTLTLNDEIDDDAANSIARFIATAVGNKNTSSVTILDSNAKLIFSGEDTDETGISASQMLSTKDKLESGVKKKVRSAVLDTKQYDSVTVAPNLVIDTSNKTIEDKQYTPADGQDQGLLDSEDNYEAESRGGIAGTPGTDANDDTTYDLPDGGTTGSTVTEYSKKYLPNSTITKTIQGGGQVQLEQSSISVVATSYVYYNEETLEKQGELENQTFDEFMAEHDEDVQVDIDANDPLYNLVANATGISRENITILAYQIPFFQPKEDKGLPYAMILSIVMIVLILGLLGFIVFKGTRSVVVEEVEPEVSVEELLASTRDNELDDIEYEEKSEVRKMIEKFVDENPVAVAQLLRNWLNDDWE